MSTQNHKRVLTGKEMPKGICQEHLLRQVNTVLPRSWIMPCIGQAVSTQIHKHLLTGKEMPSRHLLGALAAASGYVLTNFKL